MYIHKYIYTTYIPYLINQINHEALNFITQKRVKTEKRKRNKNKKKKIKRKKN